MELRHLRYFLAVAEELHFTRAAARLGIAQPPLSQQIQQLEREVGAPLFQRSARSVSLTEAGQRLARDAREILAMTETALVSARRAARGEIGSIRIGFTASASFNPFVTGTIRDYRAASPDVEVNLLEDNTANLLELFRLRRLDVAFLRPAEGETGHLTRHLLFREPMVVALPAGHRLAGPEAALPLAALAGETFILYPRRNGRGLYDSIVGACRDAGFSPVVGQEAPQMASTVNLIAAGIGISIVPASMSHIRTQGVTYRPIAGGGPFAEMSLVSRPAEARAVVEAFVALVTARARGL
ncbi:Hca operon transcriptional activator HcaR [Methylobacterium crusticola]|uniref:Hca operon transcriptional activator HcaR n=1 Tax=Methylobacterium crusticola TaxID=1697972 RepID=A0ABQ4R1H9_9HYPH|nr:LysR family transcriptional regulator [Methylobacterium crusticola]GJD51540.1 Hca operon transcriptional activator HcaR [Methylobacterium crusticola]